MSDLLINDDLNHYLFTKPVLADPQKGFLAKLLQKAVFNERFLTEKVKGTNPDGDGSGGLSNDTTVQS